MRHVVNQYLRSKQSLGIAVTYCTNTEHIEYASADEPKGALLIPRPLWLQLAGDVIDHAYTPVYIDGDYAICERGLPEYDWSENRNNEWAVSVQKARRIGAMKCLEYWAMQARDMKHTAELAGLSGTSNLYQTIIAGGMSGDSFRAMIAHRKHEQEAILASLQEQQDDDNFVMIEYGPSTKKGRATNHVVATKESPKFKARSEKL